MGEPGGLSPSDATPASKGSDTRSTPKGSKQPVGGAHIGSLIGHVTFLGAAGASPSGVDRLVSHDTSVDDEAAYLAFPDLDMDFLDEGENESSDNSQVLARLPFTTIYKEPVPYASNNRHCFMPGQRVDVEILDIDVADISIFYRSKIYTIQLIHGEFQWQVRRRFKDFRHLHEHLVMHYAKLKLPMPSREHRQRRKSMVTRNQHLPSFPIHLHPVRREAMEQRKRNVTEYLKRILSIQAFRNHPETLKFFEVSDLSFVNGLGNKTREGFVKKRSGGRRFSRGCCSCLTSYCSCCGACCMRWSHRWLIVKDTFVTYINPDEGTTRDVLLMDQDFKVESGLTATGVQHGLKISNLTRHLLLRLWTQYRCQDWANIITETAKTKAFDFTEPNDHNSFAPPREETYCNWFVDAAGYMSAVADALESAKEEIFITDWWLSPEIYMKRPVTEGEKWRLDMILKRKALAGVKIFIILYKEMEMALGINSFYTKQALLRLHHENIKVLRHPDGINLWTHHEKCVVIDQRIAFLGGIDLCYGRWDTVRHRLTDQGSVGKPFDAGDAGIHPELDRKVSSHVSSSTYSGGPEANSTWYAAANTPTPPVIGNRLPPLVIPEIRIDFPTVAHNARAGYGRSFSLDETKSGISIETPTPDAEGGSFDLTPRDGALSPTLESSRPRAMTESNLKQLDAIEETSFVEPGLDIPSVEVTPSGLDVTGGGDQSYLTAQGTAEEAHHTTSSTVYWTPPENQNVSLSTANHHVSFHDNPSFVGSPTASEDDRNTHQRPRRVGVTVPPSAQSNTTSGHSSPRPRKKTLTKTKSLPTSIPLNDSDSEVSEDSDSQPLPNGVTSTSPSVVTDNEVRKRDHSNDKDLSKNVRDSVHIEMNNMDFMDGGDSGSSHEGLDGTLTASNVANSSVETQHLRNESQSANRDSSTASESSPANDSPRTATSSDESTTNPSSALLGDINANSVLQSEIDRGAAGDDNGETAAHPPGKMDFADIVMWHRRKKLTSKLSEGAADSVPLFRDYLDDVNSPATITTELKGDEVDGGPVKPKIYQSPEDLERVLRPGGRVRQMLLRRAKRPSNLVLTGITRQDSKSLDSTASETPLVLETSGLQTPEANQFLSTAGSPIGLKPSTPKPRRKITQKAFEFKVDMKERFRKRSSKSVDMSLDSGPVHLEPGVFLVQPVPMERIIEEMGLEGSSKLWIGKDYCNFIFKDFVQLDDPFKDFIDRQVTPRMPWHDIGAVVYGRCARDVARHFIQRWNFTKLQKRKTSASYPLLLPKSYQNVFVPASVMHSHYRCKCQILRSSAKWSAGIKQTEFSIHEAYIHLIRNAKHYIYIENQFFISVMENNAVKNQIADALFDRIIQAHQRQETFRVYVIMPLLPAFEGQLGTSTGTSIQAVIHWNYMSIAHGGTSLLERLAKKVGDPFKYLSFYGLRAHSELAGNLVTELVYVHSKLMIVDDEKVIIGSANINDRSLLGDRDSELAVCVEDTQTVPAVMNGEPYRAGWYASTLRKTLFREHLGIKDGDDDLEVSDPVSSYFYKEVWLRRASINTNMYEKVFNCVPTDVVRRFDQLRVFQEQEPLAQRDKRESRSLLSKVKGHLVLLPLQFLADENLQPNLQSKEGLAPTTIWT